IVVFVPFANFVSYLDKSTSGVLRSNFSKFPLIDNCCASVSITLKSNGVVLATPLTVAVKLLPVKLKPTVFTKSTDVDDTEFTVVINVLSELVFDTVVAGEIVDCSTPFT